MSECYVDLTYRGLALARHVKLTQVRPTTGCVELPAPMPVGTAIGITTEDGVMLEATVAEVHEQVSGSERAPGMVVRPKLELDAARGWWKARVELPDVVKVEAAPAVGIVRAKPKSDGAIPELVDDGRNTAVMEAVSASGELPASASGELPASASGELAGGGRDTLVVDVPASDSIPNLVDDGKRTTAMDAVDLRALGLDPASSSGQMPTVHGDDDGDDKPDKTGNGGARKKRKKR